jgi:uncharacterized YccA/Bax inhibitor family protein
MIRSSNPALSDKAFANPTDSLEKMTIQGTVNKSFLLIGFVLVSAYYSWQSAYPDGWSHDTAPSIPGWYPIAIFAALIIAFIIIFKKTSAPFLAPVYAIFEGLTLGALSSIFEHRYPGIVMQAVFCTLGTFIALLTAYKTGIIKVTDNFRLGIAAATGGIAIVYLIDLVLMYFGRNVPFIHENGILGIAVSLFVTAIAALNLVMDFDFIERGAESGAPKYMEWYAAFGLLVTLIWLYLEILNLLSKGRKK